MVLVRSAAAGELWQSIGAGMAQQQQQELQPHQPQLTRDHNRGVAGGIAGHSEKRKHRALECESDEDDFAGFDEDATASGSENGNRFPTLDS